MKAADSLIGEVETICLLLDVDGALIDLAPTPETASAPRQLLKELTSAERRLDGKAAA